ncbi:DUF6338 family protein [Nocardiopsis sp. N85]|uniref:DUF6338 family protein n=1 Tax=Nocardiopsis sp. N85 TaxID=3029400 RepID=UPI00237FD2B7|nr:DUF6338 family protein [Nocardiopsis sp. N85]MDE3724744.1 DUF6338 family protein [Nocardiopsis sp. N85]
MPGTPTAVLIFILLVVPGIVFVLRKEALHPTEEKSAFRDMATIALVSVVVNSLMFSILMLAGLLFSGLAAAVNSLFLDPGGYASDNFSLLWWWCVGLMLVSIVIAFFAGGMDSYAARKRIWWRWTRGPYDASSSIWSRVFRQHRDNGSVGDVKYFVDCIMVNGFYYRGICEFYNPGLDETGDRDILLQSPLEVKYSDSDCFIKFRDEAQVILSSRNIISIHVTAIFGESEIALASDLDESGTEGEVEREG